MTAVVHAGLLSNGQRAIIKVTFIDPQQTSFNGVVISAFLQPSYPE